MVRTPDHPHGGLDPIELIDLVLGDADTLEEWAHALVAFSQPTSSSTRSVGRPLTDDSRDPRMLDRLNQLIRLRTRERMAELFGDTDEAKRVLAGLAEVLTAVATEFDVVADARPAPTGARRRKVVR